MVELMLPKGIFTRRLHEGNRKKPVLELLKNQTGISSQISKFKYDVSVFPDSADGRKVSSACLLCLPDSIRQLDEEVQALGIRNCFNVETLNADQPFYIRYFSAIAYFWKKSGNSVELKKYVQPQEILDDLDLFKYAKRSLENNTPGEQEKTLDGWLQLAKELVNDNITISPIFGFCDTQMFLTLIGWLLGKLFQHMFKAVCVHQGEIELLERAHATDLPIIYIPINRSFMDPIVIYWSLLSSGLPTPYFFSFKCLGKISKLFGGFGLHNKQCDQVKVRSSVIASCLRVLLKKSCSIQLTLEPYRSRTGKPSTELYGTEFLKVLYDTFNSKDIEDAHIVPVNVSYEVLPEDCCNEIKLKTNSITIWSLFKSFWRCVVNGLGCVRIDFGQPFTLREFQLSMTQNKKQLMFKDSYYQRSYNCFESYRRTFLGSELCWNEKFGSTSSLPSIYGDIGDLEFNDESESLFLDAVAIHSIYSGMSSATLMSTHLVSFLLLKRFRNGTTGANLVNEVRKLKTLLERRGRDVGFTGDIDTAVILALDLLGPESVLVCNNKQMSESKLESLFIQPVLSSKNLCRLNFYSNNVLPIFSMESVIAVALFAVIGNQLTVSRGFDIDIRIKDDVLMQQSRRVYEVFTSEFFLHATCLSAEVAIRKTFDCLNDANLLQFLMEETMQRSRRYYEEEEFNENDSEEEGNTVLASNSAAGEYFFIPYEYKVVSSEENFQHLYFLKNLLVPYLEVYAVIAAELHFLVSDNDEVLEFNESTLTQQILQKLKSIFNEHDYGELLSSEIVKSCLLTFEDHGIIYCNIDKDTKAKKIGLSESHNSHRKVLELSNNISRFVTY